MQPTSPTLDSTLVGSSNNVTIKIEGTTATALLDTGATVSTVSGSFYRDKLSHLPINPLNDLLRIECADGELLPYSGYIEASVSAVGVGLENQSSLPCLLLVVPDSKYSARVPVLLGTNVLEQLMDLTKTKHGSRFLQIARLHTPWYLSYRCMSLREKELSKNKNRLAIVRSGEKRNIVVEPNSTHVVQGVVDQTLDYQCSL